MDSETKAQALEALGLANEIRIARARLKESIRDGSQDPLEVLENPPTYAEGMSLEKFLKTIPRLGPQKTQKMLCHCQIRPSATLGEMTERQRRVLARSIKETTWR